MPWPEDIAGELPSPHPEEPATLRSDILDELHDHLLSAIEHEQLTGADEDAARKSVLSRFGDPSTIACRLWWDAMWGRIMMQRITLVFVILLCFCSVVATAFVWQAVQQGQQVTAALVAEVRAMRDEANSPEEEQFKYLDWLPTRVKLIDESGKPITDPEFKVLLMGDHLFSESERVNLIEEQPDENGVVDFGIIRPGLRSFTFKSPWNGVMRMKDYQARPGSPVDLKITCPRDVFHMVDTNLTIDWPEELQNENLWTYFRMNALPREVDGQEWNTSVTTYKWFLVDPDGSVYQTQLVYDFHESGLRALNMSDTYQLGHLELFLTGEMSYENQVIPSQFSTEYERYHEPDVVKKQYQQSVEYRIIADLTKPSRKVALAESGMRIMSMHVLQGSSSQDDEEAVAFRNLLPINLTHLDSEEFLLRAEGQPAPDRWRYQPSETIVELVRRRLEQIEAEEKPGEVGNTEAAKVSAETDKE